MRMVTGFLSFDAYGFLRACILEKSYSAFMSATLVEGAFALGCFACGDDADGVALIALAVADDQQARPGAMPEHEKALFVTGVLFIEELHSELIKEDRFGLLERHLVLFQVGRRLVGIPLELDHQYIVLTRPRPSSARWIEAV
jgi:hypothetical protein